MFQCRCGLCQQVITWRDSKALAVEEHISCQHCEERLVLNGLARSIVFMLSAVFFIMLIYLSRNWMFGFASLLIVMASIIFFFAVGEPFVKGISYAFSLLLPLQLAGSSNIDSQPANLSDSGKTRSKRRVALFARSFCCFRHFWRSQFPANASIGTNPGNG